MKKTFRFCVFLLLIWMNDTSNTAAMAFDIQQIKMSSDTLKPLTIYEEIIDPIREIPRFPGCEDLDISIQEKKKCAEEKLLEFVYGNFKYPPEVCAEGMIVIGFIIDKKGNVIEPKILRDISGGFGKEGLRVVASMPQWIPGKEFGKTVRIHYNLPIRIGLR